LFSFSVRQRKNCWLFLNKSIALHRASKFINVLLCKRAAGFKKQAAKRRPSVKIDANLAAQLPHQFTTAFYRSIAAQV
jgi:hypothetical protein